MRQPITNRPEAIAFIAETLGGYAVEHDMEAILEGCLNEQFGSYGIEHITVGRYWEIVEAHALPVAPETFTATVTTDADGCIRDYSEVSIDLAPVHQTPITTRGFGLGAGGRAPQAAQVRTRLASCVLSMGYRADFSEGDASMTRVGGGYTFKVARATRA